MAAGKPDIACNLDVFAPAEREEHEASIAAWRGAVVASRRHGDGVEFDLARHEGLVESVARFIALESRCCPFFDFDLRVPAEGPLVLAMRGPDGARVLLADLAGD